MKTKIILFAKSLLILVGFFVGAQLAFAQTAIATSCSTATLTGTITNTGGIATTVWFEYDINSNTVAAGTAARTATQVFSVPQTFTSPVLGLLPLTTYHYRVTVQNAFGIGHGQVLSLTTPSCTGGNALVTTNVASITSQTSATLNGMVNSNGVSTSAWFEWGTTPNYGYSTPLVNYGTVTTNYSNILFSLLPNTTYYFRAVAQNAQGTVYGSMLSFNTTGQGNSTFVPANNNNNGVTPTVTTLLATKITGSTAILNGLVFTTTRTPSNAWFEWGVDASVGNKTQTINVGSLPAVKHADTLSGLVSGKTYYYRIVAENMNGKTYGSTLNFVAQANTVVQDTVVIISTPVKKVVTEPTVTVVNNASAVQSLVALFIDGGTQDIAGGEKRSYHIVWNNDSKQVLKNVVLRVAFPQTMKIESMTAGAVSTQDNTVVVDLKTLAVGDLGELFIVATPATGLAKGSTLVVTANMVYTDEGGIQSDAIAYVIHQITLDVSGLGASILGAGSFMPTTFLGWIILIGLILTLVLLGNHVYSRFSEPVH